MFYISGITTTVTPVQAIEDSSTDVDNEMAEDLEEDSLIEADGEEIPTRSVFLDYRDVDPSQDSDLDSEPPLIIDEDFEDFGTSSVCVRSTSGDGTSPDGEYDVEFSAADETTQADENGLNLNGAEAAGSSFQALCQAGSNMDENNHAGSSCAQDLSAGSNSFREPPHGPNSSDDDQTEVGSIVGFEEPILTEDEANEPLNAFDGVAPEISSGSILRIAGTASRMPRYVIDAIYYTIEEIIRKELYGRVIEWFREDPENRIYRPGRDTKFGK